MRPRQHAGRYGVTFGIKYKHVFALCMKDGVTLGMTLALSIEEGDAFAGQLGKTPSNLVLEKRAEDEKDAYASAIERAIENLERPIQ